MLSATDRAELHRRSRHSSLATTTRSSESPDPSSDLERRLGLTDLEIGTMDRDGRLVVHAAATALGWLPGETLRMRVEKGIVHVSDVGGRQAGLHVGLDGRFRVSVPYGIRVLTGLLPGTRVMIATATGARLIAVIPLSTVLDLLTGAG